VLRALDDAVERHLVSDVPVGVLLSGGLDSSLLVALLARQGKSRIKTFSIGFESVGGVRGDEFQYSDLIAKQFSTEHHSLRVSAQVALDALPATSESSSIHSSSVPVAAGRSIRLCSSTRTSCLSMIRSSALTT
jgi:asparagine synthase (glutamine-hydrolysing)